ncbi:hypothetical protein RclHR1_09680003 [Rhizophagus clarus]|uniref:Uncharacterized protein n=1 Tax=Rhizophagus clarus TaxID=94130 RepID=A0A2Z6SB38_9GLOM|nr:hypothetical protein RclHR1_09680003 [Rhizophagus clarus]GES79738.1 hypothetical protein GLOIN_2v1496390 [Rhizophagus clarus]
MSSVRDETNQFPSTPTPPNHKLTRNQKFMIFLRILLMIFSEVILPFILYYVLRKFMKDIWALLISGVPPFLVVIFGIITKRRIDTLGALVIFGFIITAIISTLKNDPRIALLRESTVTGTIGLIFIITLIPIKIGSFQMRPLIFYFSRDLVTGGTFSKDNSDFKNDVIERWEREWNNYAVVRRGYRVLTALWGSGLILEVPARVIIVLKAPTVERAFFWSSIVSYSLLVVIILTDATYTRWFRKQIPREEPTDTNQTPI